MDAKLNDLPQDRESLEAILRSLILERDEQRLRAEQQRQRADELYLQNLRLQLELERYKKWYYGPRADRLTSSGDVAQALLEFAEQLEAKPIYPEDVPATASPIRDYLLDARFGVILFGNRTLLRQIGAALQDPTWGVWLGRKSCIPAGMLYRGPFETKEAAQRELVGEQVIADFTVVEEVEGFAEGTDSVSDQPIKLWRRRQQWPGETSV